MGSGSKRGDGAASPAPHCLRTTAVPEFMPSVCDGCWGAGRWGAGWMEAGGTGSAPRPCHMQVPSERSPGVKQKPQ